MALEYLQDLPEEYRDTASLRIQAAYHAAKDAAKLGQWQKAYDLLLLLPLNRMPKGMRDAKELYLEACEALGTEPFPEDPPVTLTAAPTETLTATPTAAPTETPTATPTDALTETTATVPEVSPTETALSTPAPAVSPGITAEDQSFLVLDEEEEP